MSFKVATMCSGIGSPEQSLRELGVPHENVFACEKDKFARQTYLANFNPGIMYHDMTTEAWDLPEHYADLIVAGIPCQSFSLAGKRQGENDPRGLLIYDFIRYVKNQRPKVFIIENVKGLLFDCGGVTFSKWCDLLGHSRNGNGSLFTNPESCGYNLHYRVLNAKHYGLPQNRERIFIVGIRPDIEIGFRWPKAVILKDRLIDLLESEIDEKYYLSDKQIKALLKQDKKFSSRIISPNDICPTILANEAKSGSDSVVIKLGPIIFRRLTPRECLYVNGYPKSYVTNQSDFYIRKQAGNSIPIHMMKALLKQLLPILAP